MDMYFRSSTIWLLLVAVLLGSLVTSYKNDAERSNSQTESRILTDQPAIGYLDFSWEGLMSVPVISPGQLVHTLDLSHNNLHSLYNDSFHPYPNVTKLILSSDNITIIESKTFSNLQSLTEVDLSYNRLTFIHPSMFVLNTNLQALSLQGNPLYTFESGMPFLIATSLRSLDLSHCHLLQFSTESLSGLPKLEILDLRQNNLPQLSVNNISALSSLKLTGNPWQCDCHFHDLLVWVSSNQMMDTDIETDNTVQCWMGDKMRNLITKKDWDSICMEATGLPTDHKIITELAVTSSKNDYAILDRKSDSVFPANNKDDDGDVWMFEDYNQEIFSFDYDNDSEEVDADISPSAGEIRKSVHQNYTGLNLTVSMKVGDNHKKLSTKDEVINSSTYFLRSNNNFISELVDIDSYGEYSGESEDFDKFDSDNISNLSAEIPSLDQEDSDLTGSMKIGDNRTAVNTSYKLIDSIIVSISAEDNFVPDDTDLGSYDYELYGEFQDSEELHNDASVAEIPVVDNEDHNTPVDVNYTLENSNLQELHSKTKLPIYTTNFSSQGNYVIMDDIASDKNSKEVVRNAEDVDSSFQFQNIYDDFNSEDIVVPGAFDFDIWDSMEVNKYELSPDTTRFPDTIDEDNFDVDTLIAFVLKGLNSAADVQEHETLMNQNDKAPNERYLKVYTIIRFLILAGMVLVVVFLLIVIFYCITNVHYTPAFPTQVNEYKKLKNSISEKELVQNV